MLGWRLLLGSLFIAGLVGVCWLDAHPTQDLPTGSWLLPLAMLVCAVASEEMLRLVGLWSDWPQNWIVFGGNLAIVAASGAAVVWRPLTRASAMERAGWPLVALTLGMLISIVGELLRYNRPGVAMPRIARATLSMAYVGLTIGFLVQLRLLRDDWQGMTALVSVIAIVKTGDTAAYTVGRLVGRHKMTPVLSPGKTWEGAIGALIFAPLASWLVFSWLMPTQSPGVELGFHWNWIVYGVIICVAGMVGDLAESLLKRDAGLKNSSAWMPGFGGVLDVLDSMMFAAPVAWLLWIIGFV